MKPDLKVVAPPPKTETVAERVRRLTAEAQGLASEHVNALLAQMAATEKTARDIAEGGGAYHVGAQEMAKRVADSLASQLETLTQIVGRAG